MMQLWIAGRRIDSIGCLRKLFSGSEGEELTALCSEVLRKASDGMFVPWLGRCFETCPRRGEWERSVVTEGNKIDLSECRTLLERNQDWDSLSEDVAQAFAAICGVDGKSFLNATSHARKNLKDACRHMQQIESQFWYQDDAYARRAVEGFPADRMAVDSDSLARALASADRKAGHNSVDIYLLNIGKAFIIRDLKKLLNVRLVGYGNPFVSFSPHLRGMTLDMIDRNVKFERMDLHRQGVELFGFEGRCIEVVFD